MAVPDANFVVERFARSVRGSLQHLLGNVQGPGIVALSGGADSMALACALVAQWPAPVHLAHVNHLLRGEASDADEAFVRAFCPQHPHHVLRADVAHLAQSTNTNLEATAREVRYRYFAELADQLGLSWIATAHTLDDQAETVLHRLVRGSGLRGLRGIAACRPLTPQCILVRPMLTETRSAVIAYLQALGQPWREDASNQDARFTRNRLRHELLPLLRTYNPAVASNLSQLAEQAHETYSDLEAVVQQLLLKSERPKAGRVCVFVQSDLAAVPLHHVRELFHIVWEREHWPRNSMTFEHWRRVADTACGKHPAWDLPDGIRMECRRGIVRVGPRDDLQE